MIIPVPILIVIGVFWSGAVKLHAAVLGAQFSIPVIWLLAAAVVLAAAAAVLYLFRSIMRDGGLRLSPAWSS